MNAVPCRTKNSYLHADTPRRRYGKAVTFPDITDSANCEDDFSIFVIGCHVLLRLSDCYAFDYVSSTLVSIKYYY